jgi:uncharacterized iron-regulated protein
MVPLKRALVVAAVLSIGFSNALPGEAGQAQTPPPAQTAGQVAPAAEKPDLSLTLKIGDPKLKDKTMDVGLGAIMSAASGLPVGFDRMIEAMKASRFIYVGETHNSMPMHEIQLQVIRALYEQDRRLAIGLEMLPVTVQETLNKWSLGLLAEEDFIREVRWYVNWNFNFGYYAKIFEFAKEHRLPVYALNVPREIITKIRMRGYASLTDEEKKLVPKEPDVSNQDHRALVKAIFESAELPPQMKGPGLEMVFEGLYRGQSAWDEVMGANAVRGAASEGRRLVVCAGSGHVLYNLGLNRRAFEANHEPFKTVIAVVLPAGKKSLTVTRTLGDYVFGLAPEAKPAFPSIGLALKKVENLENLVVESKPADGAASRSDFEKGDVILSVDGKAYSDINELRMYTAGFKCGEEIKFRLLRGGAVRDVVLKFGTAEPPAAPERKRP